jgi:23S rRNA (uracil1939-C5)-methyltransferase
MANPRRYRNKAQYPIARKDGGVRMGFYARHSHTIIEHPACDAHPPVMTRIRDVVREFLATRQVSIYDETTHSGLVRHLLIRRGMATGECMVVLVINGEALPYQQGFVKSLTETIPDIVSIQLNYNTSDTNNILGQTSEVLWGKSTVRDRLGDFWFDISPNSFYQVNSQQAEVLYRTVQQYAGLHGTEMVFDLYCGIGTIALSLARHTGYVYGIDAVPQAIQDASQNAAENGVKNVGLLTGAAEQCFPDMVRQGIPADVVILDPPRKGCDRALLEALAACRPKRLVYVSCNPKSLLRDLALLNQHGFRCVEMQPVDMFPHTMHTECVASIIRQS